MIKQLRLTTALIILLVIVGASIFAPQLATHNPFEPAMAERLMRPCAAHIFGTDALGRDMFSRIVYGGRESILLSLLSSFLSLMLGIIIGVLCGFYGGWLDRGMTAVCNVFQGIPSSCFMIAIVGILGTGIESLVMALVLISWAGISRIVRAEVIGLKQEPFVEGLQALGCSNWRLMWCHLLPHITNKLVVLFTIKVGRGMLSIAGMSFLGLGVQPPTPDWGVMINDAMMYYRSAPHLILVPGLCIILLIYAINLLGDTLRDRLDIRNDEVRKW